jgi:hypothetical protein
MTAAKQPSAILAARRCPDGTVTVARQGDKLALRWFGSIQDDVVVAYGTLSRK